MAYASTQSQEKFAALMETHTIFFVHQLELQTALYIFVWIITLYDKLFFKKNQSK